MESKSASSPDLSSADARAQLGALADSQNAIGDRLATPSWYHPALAALAALGVSSAVRSGALPPWSVWVAAATAALVAWWAGRRFDVAYGASLRAQG